MLECTFLSWDNIHVMFYILYLEYYYYDYYDIIFLIVFFKATNECGQTGNIGPILNGTSFYADPLCCSFV